MSLITLFTKETPKLGGYDFDAVLDEDLEYSVTVPTYPVESGAEISDHRIINPIKYRLTVVISNTPVSQELGDFIAAMSGGLVSNLSDNPAIAAVTGLSAGFLASSKNTRAATALGQLITLMESQQPFDVDTGDRLLKNMVVTKISRKRDPSNENALVASVELQEFIELSRLNRIGQPSHDDLKKDSIEQAACSAFVSKGLTSVNNAGQEYRKKIKELLE